jgi:hypothetical protein
MPALGGVIEIPALWERVQSRYPDIDRETFDNALKRLSEQQIIDLKFAMDTLSVKDPEAGIQHPKGLLYYVLWRPEKKQETQLEQIKKAFSHYDTIEDRTSDWLTMTQSGIQYELEGYTLEQMKQAAARILKTGDRRIKNRQKMIDRILKRMKEYRSRFEFGSEGLTEEVLKQAYERVKQKEPRFSTLIPFNYLKKELPQYDNEQINELLLKLEKKRIIDLQVAYDASQVNEPEYGIELPGRGLVYFVRWRDNKKKQLSETEIKELFIREAKDVWDESSLIDQIELTVEIKDQKKLMSLLSSGKQRAIGSSLIQVPKEFQLLISKEALNLPEEKFRDYLRHETIHLGYPRHDKGFRKLAKEKNIPLTILHGESGTFKVQEKRGRRYHTINEFETLAEAELYAKQVAAEEGKKVRVHY